MEPEQSTARRRVLVVDDEPNIVISLEFLLVNAGYEVTIARDGMQALQMAASWRPDLVVLDIMLPVVNGFEVCKQLRASRELKDVKILMLTARGREGEIEKGLALGANAYLTKPFATRELIETTKRMLGV